MASCKDCVHVEVCPFKRYRVEKDRMEKRCSFFKDRSRFVELPCKVGDRLYVTISKSKYIAEYVVIAFWLEESGTIIRIVDTRFFTVSVLFVQDLGTKAFFTKEQAEQALKERENNG